MPRRNLHAQPGPDPETRFDHWLDAYVTGTPGNDASRDETHGQLARAQSGARQLHDLAAHPVTAPAAQPARQRIREDLMYSGTLAAGGGTTWISPRERERGPKWWSPNSPVVAGALVIALILALSAGFIWNQRPAPSSDAPGAPGFAVAPSGATPAGNALACGAPEYRPVVEGNANAGDLAMLGGTEEPIVRNDESVTIPQANGDDITLPPATFPLPAVPGVYIAYTQDGISTVTNTNTGEVWELDAHEPDVVESRTSSAIFTTMVTAGPYVIAPADDQGFDYTILDVRTGESTTTSKLLGDLFPWTAVPRAGTIFEFDIGERFGGGRLDQDSDHQALQFVRASKFLADIGDEQMSTHAGAITDRELNDTVAVVLPGSVGDAAVVDVGDIYGSYHDPQEIQIAGLGQYRNPGSDVTTFSNDGSLIAWRGWSGSGGDARFGFFIANASDTVHPIAYSPVTTPPSPSSATIAFSPDNATLYVRLGNAIEAIDVSSGAMTEVATSPTSLPVNAVNEDAGSVLFSKGSEAWLLDTATDDVTRQEQLDGYFFYSRLTDTGLASAQKLMLAGSGPGNGETRSRIVVNTATGAIISETSEPTTPDNRWQTTTDVVAADPRHIVATNDDASLRITNLESGKSWNLALPDTGGGTTSTTLKISPSSTCLLLDVFDASDDGASATPARSEADRLRAWVAPLQPGAGWTKLDVALTGWWQVAGQTEPHTLPAQDFATPESSTGAQDDGTATAAVTPLGSFSPNAVQKTIQVDLDGVLAGDEDAVTDARQAITDAFGQYDTEGCRAGFVLTSSRAPSLNEGVALSRAINDLLPEAMPDVFGDVQSEAIALPDTEPPGEVQVEVFFFSGCEAIGEDAFETDFRTVSNLNINLRSGPTTASDIVTVLPPGTPLMSVKSGQHPGTPVAQTDANGQQWRKVRTEDGETGWLRDVDLDPASGPVPAPASATPEAG